MVAIAIVVAQPGAAAAGRRGVELPARGVFVPGKSLAGVRLGDTPAAVRARWGTSFKVCGFCEDRVWLYFYTRGTQTHWPDGEPLRPYPESVGAAVVFRHGRAVSVFTLGTPPGWRTPEGLLLGEDIIRITDLYGLLDLKRCIGYSALSERNADGVWSIYTFHESVYGFALTAPSEPVCQ